MDSIRQYILSVTAAVAICGFCTVLFNNKGTFGAIIKLLSGIFLAITMISPLVKLEIGDYTQFFEDITADAQNASSHGKQMADDATKGIIKSQTEAYILDKATSLGLDITVDVFLDNDTSFVPNGVMIHGAAAPLAKSRLQQYITDDLGIPEENLKWTEQP